jgi:hypothetical protein
MKICAEQTVLGRLATRAARSAAACAPAPWLLPSYLKVLLWKGIIEKRPFSGRGRASRPTNQGEAEQSGTGTKSASRRCASWNYRGHQFKFTNEAHSFPCDDQQARCVMVRNLDVSGLVGRCQALEDPTQPLVDGGEVAVSKGGGCLAFGVSGARGTPLPRFALAGRDGGRDAPSRLVHGTLVRRHWQSHSGRADARCNCGADSRPAQLEILSFAVPSEGQKRPEGHSDRASVGQDSRGIALHGTDQDGVFGRQAVKTASSPFAPIFSIAESGDVSTKQLLESVGSWRASFFRVHAVYECESSHRLGAQTTFRHSVEAARHAGGRADCYAGKLTNTDMKVIKYIMALVFLALAPFGAFAAFTDPAADINTAVSGAATGASAAYTSTLTILASVVIVGLVIWGLRKGVRPR